MKIESHKNIDEESKASLKQFRHEQILANIRYHKIFLSLIIIINIGLLFFILTYKIKLNQIKSLSKTHSSSINSNDNELLTLQTSMDHKIVNIASLTKNGNFRFSLIFDNSEDFNIVKNLAYGYNTDPDLDLKEKHIFFLYQNFIENDGFLGFIRSISYFENIFLFIQTEKGNKFGIFVKDIIIQDNYHEFKGKTNDIFLYSFETKKKYNFIGDKKKSISFTKEKMISVGDDEIVIFSDFWDKGGYIKYPLKSFDLSNTDTNIFTGENGEFFIRYIEGYSFIRF